MTSVSSDAAATDASALRASASRRRYGVALIVAGVSGAAGLIHQLLWTRRLVDLLGADTDTFARVIGTFFIGLAIGAWWASKPAPLHTNFWRRVALTEGAVAISALPALFAVPMMDRVWGVAGAAAWVDWLAPLILVGVPAGFMGMVLPWMIRGLDAGHRAAGAMWIYAVNVLGGVCGVVLAVHVGLPRLGLVVAGACGAGLNLVAGLGAAGLAASRQSTAWTGTGSDSRAILPANIGGLRLLAAASGFLVLSGEVVLQHQFAQITVNSMFSSATVLVVVLSALTAGAVIASVALRRLADERQVLRVALMAAAVAWLGQPFLMAGLTGHLQIMPHELPPAIYSLQVGFLGLVTAGPAFMAAGVVFPLVLRMAAGNGHAGEGRETGVILCWNGLGGWLGAELGSSWIGPSLGLWGSALLLSAIYLLLPLIIASEATGRFVRSRVSWAPAWVGLLILVAVLSCRALPEVGLGPGERALSVVVAREGVVAVVERNPADRRMVFNNSYSLGGSSSAANQERQAHLPILLHGTARTVGLIGLATGSTAAGAALHPGLERIDAIELSPAVQRLGREFFGPFNRDVFADPRLRVVSGDGRRVIARERGTYDVVIGDLFLPWRTGEGRLYTREHFGNVQASLKADGLFCQWLPMYQLTRPQFDAIARTFVAVFPNAFAIRGDFYAERPILGLVGGRSMDRLSWPAIAAACEKLRLGGETQDPLVRHADGLAMLLLGPLAQPEGSGVITLANAWLEWSAGRNIIGLREPWFVGVPLATHLRSMHRSGVVHLPESMRAWHDAGQFFVTLEIAAHMQHAQHAHLEAQLSTRLPPAMVGDREASWEQWPMSHRPARGHWP
jgi:spermidine synthase